MMSLCHGDGVKPVVRCGQLILRSQRLVASVAALLPSNRSMGVFMKFNYTQVRSLSKQEFEKRMAKPRELNNPKLFTKSDGDEVQRVERLLDISEGTLQGVDQFVERVTCECGRVLTMYDLVFTALVDADHDKSAVLHTMIGSKFVVNPPRQIRCSACSRMTPKAHRYKCRGYGCSAK